MIEDNDISTKPTTGPGDDPAELSSDTLERIRKRTQDALSKMYKGRDVEVRLASYDRDIAEQVEHFKSGASQTPLSLHNFGKAGDYAIFIDGERVTADGSEGIKGSLEPYRVLGHFAKQEDMFWGWPWDSGHVGETRYVNEYLKQNPEAVNHPEVKEAYEWMKQQDKLPAGLKGIATTIGETLGDPFEGEFSGGGTSESTLLEPLDPTERISGESGEDEPPEEDPGNQGTEETGARPSFQLTAPRFDPGFASATPDATDTAEVPITGPPRPGVPADRPTDRIADPDLDVPGDDMGSPDPLPEDGPTPAAADTNDQEIPGMPPPPDQLDTLPPPAQLGQSGPPPIGEDGLPPPPDQLDTLPPPPEELAKDAGGLPPPPKPDPKGSEKPEKLAPSKRMDFSEDEQEFEEQFRTKLVSKLADREKELRGKLTGERRTRKKLNPRTGNTYRTDEVLTDEGKRLKGEADKLRERRLGLIDQLEDISKEETSFTERAGAGFKKSFLNMKNQINNIANYDHARILENFKKIDSGELDTYFMPDGRLASYAKADEQTRKQMKQDLIDRMSENTSAIIENRNKSADLYENPMTKAMVEADSFEEGFDAFMRNPIDAITGLSAESSLQMVPGMTLGALGALVGNAPGAFAGFALGSGSVEFGAALGEGVLEKANEDGRTSEFVNERLREAGVIGEGQDGITQLENLKAYQEDIVGSIPDMPEENRESLFEDMRREGLVASETVDGQQVERFAGEPEELLRAIGNNPGAVRYLQENLPPDKYGGINPTAVGQNLKQFNELSSHISELLKDPDSVLHHKAMNVLEDTDAMEDVAQRAAIRGGVIGSAEGLTAVIPGSAIAKQIGKARAMSKALGGAGKLSLSDKARVAGSFSLAIGAGGAGGGGGEAGAMFATGEDLRPGEIMAEAVPEFISAPFDVGGVVAGLNRSQLTQNEQEIVDGIRRERERLNVPFRPANEALIQDTEQTTTPPQGEPTIDVTSDEEIESNLKPKLQEIEGVGEVQFDRGAEGLKIFFPKESGELDTFINLNTDEGAITLQGISGTQTGSIRGDRIMKGIVDFAVDNNIEFRSDQDVTQKVFTGAQRLESLGYNVEFAEESNREQRAGRIITKDGSPVFKVTGRAQRQQESDGLTTRVNSIFPDNPVEIVDNDAGRTIRVQNEEGGLDSYAEIEEDENSVTLRGLVSSGNGPQLSRAIIDDALERGKEFRSDSKVIGSMLSAAERLESQGYNVQITPEENQVMISTPEGPQVVSSDGSPVFTIAPPETEPQQELGRPVPEEKRTGEPQFRKGLSIAARNPDGQTFVGGTSHGDLINQFDTQIDIGRAEQGFFTEDGRFLTRAEAAEFMGKGQPAQEQQVEEEQPGSQERMASLFSELDDMSTEFSRLAKNENLLDADEKRRLDELSQQRSNIISDIRSEAEQAGLNRSAPLSEIRQSIEQEDVAGESTPQVEDTVESTTEEADQPAEEQTTRENILFGEDLAETTETVEREVLDGSYSVRRGSDGIKVIRAETGEAVSRQSNNWIAAVAEFMVAEVENGAELINDENIDNLEDYLTAVLNASTTPLEIAQAYILARDMMAEQRESGGRGVLQQFFEEGGKIRPQDFAEFSDSIEISEQPRLRFFTDEDATPLDVQAEILSRRGAREVSPEEIIDFLVEDFFEQSRENDIDVRLRERFQQVTGQSLTDSLVAEVERRATEEFTAEDGSILPEVRSLIDEYIDEDGFVDYRRLWNEALADDQAKGFFTQFPGDLSEQQYQQLKTEVQNAAENSTQTETQADRSQAAQTPSQEQGGAQQGSGLYGSGNQIISRERAMKAREELRKGLGGQYNSFVDPRYIKQMMELAMFHAEAGSRKFSDFAAAMIADVGDKIKPYLRSIYKQLKYRSDIDKSEFSSDAEIIAWEEENLSEDNLINSIDREFREAVAQQEAEGYKSMGRPELANPVNHEQGRDAVDFMDEKRKQEGNPSPKSDKVVAEEARRRLAEDYEGEKQRLINMTQDFNAGQWSDVDVKMAKIIMGRESREALSSNNKADLFNFFLFTGIYRQAGTEQARAMRMRRDDTKSPEERKAEMVKDVFEDTKATVDIVVEIHRLAEQAQRGEITREEFREQVRAKLGDHKSQRKKSSIQSWIRRIFGREVKDSDLDDMYDAARDGEKSVQEVINDNAGKMNVPKTSIAQLLQLESHIENVESSPIGPERNQALLELLEFIEESNIVGGRFSRGLRATVDDLLNRGHELFDSTEDILDNVREHVMENISQAILTPPKEVQRRMDEAASEIDRQEIWNEYYERFQSIKDALLKKDGIDIENLTMEDITDPVLMHTILRRFQAANANFDSKAYEFWNNAILSAFTTHAVNIAGTSANLFYKSIPIRFYEAFVNTFGRDPNEAQWGEFKYFWKGFFTHIPQALKYAGLAWQTESRLFAEELGLERGVGKFQDKMEKGVAIKGKKGRFVRAFGWRPLTMMDEFHKVIAFRAQLAAEAYREARRLGLKGEDIAEFIQAQQRNPNGQIAEAAWGWALEVAFQEDPGPITSGFVNLRQEHELIKYGLPFVRTPGNLLKQGTRKGPLGALNIIHRATMAGTYKLGLSKDSKWEYSRQEVTKHMAEQFAFWSMFGMGMFLANQWDDDDDPRPIITGSGASFRKQSQFRFEQQNYPSQSIRLPGTDRYYSYRRFDPFATMIANTVDAAEAISKNESGKDVLENMNEYFSKNFRLIQDKSYFQFMGDVMRMIEYPASALDWMGNFAASWMPNIIRHNVRAGDDYVREYTKGDATKTVSDVTGSVIERTAQKAWPDSDFQPPPRVDWLGFPVKKDAFGGATQTHLYRILSPAISVDNPPSSFDALVMRWNNQNPNEQWFPTVPSDQITIDGQKVSLNQEQYFDYVQRRGFHTMRLLDEQYYKFDFDFPLQEDIDRLQGAQRKAGTIAKEEMINEGLIIPPIPK